jgi:hypothetical protein
MEWIPIMFISLLIGVMLYTFGCLVDLQTATSLEKKWKLYPMIDFTCFCGWKQTLMCRWMIPNQLYRVSKIKRHMGSCLLWILNADFNGLSPSWAHQYAKDLRGSIESPSTILTPAWYLEQAKKRSQREREGRSPFDEKGDKDYKA